MSTTIVSQSQPHYPQQSTQQLSTSTALSSDKIYCHGDILHAIQMAEVNSDSKTFVDMPMKQGVNETLDKFSAWNSNNINATSEQLRLFQNDTFNPPGHELEEYTPTDWIEEPEAFKRILDHDYRQWAHDLNDLWKVLGRKMSDNVQQNPDLYSIIYVPNPVIVPGGRFREFYYWDSYWIVRGLLYSEMHDTVRGMLENFVSIVERIGHIPNGGRVYYAERSQPPMFIPMMKSYFDFTQNLTFIRSHIDVMEDEFRYWMEKHAVQVNGHTMYKYGDFSSGPRPESYFEDVDTASHLENATERENLYSELKAAAESGMDFSTRWYINLDDGGTTNGSLSDTKCRSIIPVELNAFLYWNAQILADFYLRMNNFTKVEEYTSIANNIARAIQDVLWNEEVGAWLDYDLIHGKQRNFFTPTNLSPLWVKCYDEENSAAIAEKVLKYIENEELDSYPGGVPNTKAEKGEQWDFPNVWPPMQYMLIMGLDGLNDKNAKELAYKWAERWVLSNFIAYGPNKEMYEKYDCQVLGGHGSGGEYGVQLGFGWTNGVILELLVKYSDRLSSSSAVSLSNLWSIKTFFGSVVVLLISQIRRFIG